MSRTTRTLTAALAMTLAGTGVAQGAIAGAPAFTLSPFTKAQAGAGNAVALTMRWGPPQFLANGANDHQEVIVTELPLGSPQKYSATKTQGSLGPIFTSNGRPQRITVAACEQASCVLGSVNTAETTGTTMIDATPPAGTVVINGGAPATNNRTVSLGLTATDPLIEGRPDTSSGVTQFAVDVDGNGTIPCDVFIPGDTSGCAQAFASTGTATVTAGDGPKTVGVVFGDGARLPSVPCATPFCVIVLGNPILGNVSDEATDTILLDTVKPTAVATLDRTSVGREGAVAFSSASSTDPGGANASGIDPALTTWDFKDGTPPVTGATATHAYATAGTFIGQLRVKDRAGNVSDAGAFTVVVSPKPGEVLSGSGSIAGISGTAQFSVSGLQVRARYVRSRLKGSVKVTGSSIAAGNLRLVVRRGARGKVLRASSARIGTAGFTRTVTLPPTLVPGRYTLTLVGPGGTLSTVLSITAPREGVLRAAAVVVSRRTAVAKFAFAASPNPALRKNLTVTWSQGGRILAVVKAPSAAALASALPSGIVLAKGPVKATLRASAIVVGSATAVVR